MVQWVPGGCCWTLSHKSPCSLDFKTCQNFHGSLTDICVSAKVLYTEFPWIFNRRMCICESAIRGRGEVMPCNCTLFYWLICFLLALKLPQYQSLKSLICVNWRLWIAYKVYRQVDSVLLSIWVITGLSWMVEQLFSVPNHFNILREMVRLLCFLGLWLWSMDNARFDHV